MEKISVEFTKEQLEFLVKIFGRVATSSFVECIEYSCSSDKEIQLMKKWILSNHQELHKTLKIVYNPEPAYEYKVLYAPLDNPCLANYFVSSAYYTSLEDFYTKNQGNNKPIYLIEDSKRERK